jgi:hypothetical protein
MPSPESPTKRIVTVSTWTLFLAAEAGVDMSPWFSLGGVKAGVAEPVFRWSHVCRKRAACMPDHPSKVKDAMGSNYLE